MKDNYKRLGDYIRLVDRRNRDNALGVDRLLGINIKKEFMPSVANVSGRDLSKYKVIRKFFLLVMYVGWDEGLPIAAIEEQRRYVSLKQAFKGLGYEL